MRVAIIEDSVQEFEDMVEAASEDGHAVLGVHICCDPRYAFSPCALRENEYHTRSIDEAVEAIRAFVPDIVFIDYKLGLRETGEDFARKLGYPREKCVGTSSTYDQRAYCSRRMWKTSFRAYPHAKEEFLNLLK